jgi:hypothetical protein
VAGNAFSAYLRVISFWGWLTVGLSRERTDPSCFEKILILSQTLGEDVVYNWTLCRCLKHVTADIKCRMVGMLSIGAKVHTGHWAIRLS